MHPVYEEPPALGLLTKVRGQARWIAWIQVPESLVSDSLRC